MALYISGWVMEFRVLRFSASEKIIWPSFSLLRSPLSKKTSFPKLAWIFFHPLVPGKTTEKQDKSVKHLCPQWQTIPMKICQVSDGMFNFRNYITKLKHKIAVQPHTMEISSVFGACLLLVNKFKYLPTKDSEDGHY